MSKTQIPEMRIPENFQTTITDMSNDFSKTFPEYKELWKNWTSESFQSMTESEVNVELNYLLKYVLSIYPERFLDIISQNEKIFEVDAKANTLLLPGIDFKLLFNCQGVSNSTKSTMWSYLKTILLSVVGENFGGMSDMFDGLNEDELCAKLSETIDRMGDFFQNEEDPSDTCENPKEFDISGSGLPEGKFDIFSQFKDLFDGKIGSLAKSMAEEISGELNEIFGSDAENVRSTKDVIENFMKNPDKIVKLLKLLNDHLQKKLASGEINQEEMMKELMSLISKTNSNGVNFEELFKDIPKGSIEEIIGKVGGMSGVEGMGGLDDMLSKIGGMSGILKMFSKMGGLSGIQKMMSQFGGNENNDLSQIMKSVAGIMGNNNKPKLNKNDVVSDTSKMSLHDKMKNRILIKKLKEAEKQLVEDNRIKESLKNYVPYDFGEDDKKVFKIAGEEGKQETSAVIRSDLETNDSKTKVKSINKKKKSKSKK
jgi:hypothetical protein